MEIDYIKVDKCHFIAVDAEKKLKTLSLFIGVPEMKFNVKNVEEE